MQSEVRNSKLTRSAVCAAALLAATLAFASAAAAGTDVAAAGVSEAADPTGGPSYTLADATLFTAIGLGVLHHVDHVVRDNHSGFPFKREVTPFTPSLLVYPILLVPYYLDGGPLANLLSSGSVLVGVQIAHVFAEPPGDQYDPWVDESNLLGVSSPATGRIAQGISFALSAALIANVTANLLDGFEHGFTWKRARGHRPARAAIAPFASGDGGGLVLSLQLD